MVSNTTDTTDSPLTKTFLCIIPEQTLADELRSTQELLTRLPSFEAFASPSLLLTPKIQRSDFVDKAFQSFISEKESGGVSFAVMHTGCSKKRDNKHLLSISVFFEKALWRSVIAVRRKVGLGQKTNKLGYYPTIALGYINHDDLIRLQEIGFFTRSEEVSTYGGKLSVCVE